MNIKCPRCGEYLKCDIIYRYGTPIINHRCFNCDYVDSNNQAYDYKTDYNPNHNMMTCSTESNVLFDKNITTKGNDNYE